MDQRFAGFAVVDEILCRPGQSHEVVSRYHLAPEQAAQLDGPCTAGLASRYKAYSTHPMQIVPCKVSRSFGIEEDAQCLEITFSAQGHTKTAAVFAVDSLCKATLTPNGQLTWQSATETETLDLFTLEREAFSP